MKIFFCLLVFVAFSSAAFSQFYSFFSDSANNPAAVIKAQGIKRDSVSCSTRSKGTVNTIKGGLELYDEQGRVTVRQYLHKGKAFSQDSFYYHPDGRVRQVVSMGGTGTPFMISDRYYDELGRDTGGSTQMLTKINNGNNATDRREYDRAGQLVKKFLQPEGKPSYQTEAYQYDDEGRLSQMDVFKADGSLWYTTLYEYTRQKKTLYRKNEQGTKKYMTFSYDQQGRCTRIDWFLLKETWKYSFTYNPDGTLQQRKAITGTKTSTEQHFYSK